MLKLCSCLIALTLLLEGADDPRAVQEEEVILPVLMYHEVKREEPGKNVILPEEMESDLRYLAGAGYTTVLMEDVIAYVYAGKALPEKPILLSFDDGYGSNYRNLYPLLRKYQARAVICVIGRSADEFSLLPEDGGPYVHATWNQLLEMRDSGLVELQNHSYDLHRDTPEARGCARRWNERGADYERRVRGDVDRLQDELFRRTGCASTTFAYPYGLYDEDLEGILADMGFLATLTCDFGVNRLTRDPDCLRGMKRICRSHGADLGSLLEQAGSAAA